MSCVSYAWAALLSGKLFGESCPSYRFCSPGPQNGDVDPQARHAWSRDSHATLPNGDAAWQASSHAQQTKGTHFNPLDFIKGRRRSKTFETVTAAKQWALETGKDETSWSWAFFNLTVGELIERYCPQALWQKSISSQKTYDTQLGWWQEGLGTYKANDTDLPKLIPECGAPGPAEKRRMAPLQSVVRALALGPDPGAAGLAGRGWLSPARQGPQAVRPLTSPRCQGA